MIKSVFSVLDKKAGRYGPLQLVDSPAVFLRDFQDYLRREPTSVVAEHPEDFVVMAVGSFHDETGQLIGLAHAEQFIEVASLVVKAE